MLSGYLEDSWSMSQKFRFGFISRKLTESASEVEIYSFGSYNVVKKAGLLAV